MWWCVVPFEAAKSDTSKLRDNGGHELDCGSVRELDFYSPALLRRFIPRV